MTIAIIAAVCVIGVLALAFQVIEPLVEASQEPPRRVRRPARRGRSANRGFLSVP
jgi:hypothetical protein